MKWRRSNQSKISLNSFCETSWKRPRRVPIVVLRDTASGMVMSTFCFCLWRREGWLKWKYLKVHLLFDHQKYQVNIYSRFSSNSEANASELLVNLEDMFTWHDIWKCFYRIHLIKITLPLVRGNISLRFTRNSEANASEFLEILKKCFPVLKLSLAFVHLFVHTGEELPWGIMLLTKSTRMVPNTRDQELNLRSCETLASRPTTLTTVPCCRQSFDIVLRIT